MISALLARLSRTRAGVTADADAETKILAVDNARRDAVDAFVDALADIDHPIDAHTVTRHRPIPGRCGTTTCAVCAGPVPEPWPCPPLLAVAHHHGVRVPHGALT